MADDKLLGYTAFQSALNDIERQLPQQLKEAAKQVAQDWIAAAKNNAPGNATKDAQALTIGTDTDGATIVNDSPTFFGFEFGGQGKPSTMHFPPHNGQRGYWFFPAGRANADNFQKVWDAAIDDATKAWDHKE